VRDHVERNKRRHTGNGAIYRASREVNPLALAELDRVVEIWADTCLQLRDQDLKVMQRLVNAQDRLMPVALEAAE
jgi:DSF synthase